MVFLDCSQSRPLSGLLICEAARRVVRSQDHFLSSDHDCAWPGQPQQLLQPVACATEVLVLGQALRSSCCTTVHAISNTQAISLIYCHCEGGPQAALHSPGATYNTVSAVWPLPANSFRSSCAYPSHDTGYTPTSFHSRFPGSGPVREHNPHLIRSAQTQSGL